MKKKSILKGKNYKRKTVIMQLGVMFFETKFSILYLKIRITSKQRFFLTFVALFDLIWINDKTTTFTHCKKRQKTNAQDIKHKN